jgi:hypothetical protein
MECLMIGFDGQERAGDGPDSVYNVVMALASLRDTYEVEDIPIPAAIAAPPEVALAHFALDNRRQRLSDLLSPVA